MKYTINKNTLDYLEKLRRSEKTGSPVGEYHANPDAVDQLISENGLRIEGLSFYPQIDLMLIVLNNKKVLKRNISDFKRLHAADLPSLTRYEVSPMGVHWPELDEDLSLRGFLEYELAFSDSPKA